MNVTENYDALVIGAGPVGCILAERFASQLGWKVLLVDQRDHLAGNCYDRVNESGVLVHQYGPHYFRTSNRALLDYLSQFTTWIPGNYLVQAQFQNELYPIPINLLTLRKFFKRDLDETSAKALLEEKRIPIENPKNSEEFVLSRVGRELYEAFYLGYTVKQWARHPTELLPSVCGRIPIRLNEDCRYVDQEFQLMPEQGYTQLFKKMVNHPNIELRLGTTFQQVKDQVKRKLTIYSGPVDHYFDFKLGKLPWRSLEFKWKTYSVEYKQPCVQINYSNDHDYTRSVEIKHVTRQKHPETTLSFEYPRADGDPYYPIPGVENQALYEKYRELAETETKDRKVYFVGRLAQYRYMNMDEAMETALRTFSEIQNQYS